MQISSQIREIDLPTFTDERGLLLAVEQGEGTLPFVPLRSFYLMDVPRDQMRAGHAVDSELFIIVLKGEISLIHHSHEDEIIELKINRNNIGFHIPPRNYIELINFSPEAIVVVYASKKFKDTNYYSLNDLKENR